MSAIALPVDPRSVALHAIPKKAVGAEIGVHNGTFSARILRQTTPTKLYLIDPWQHSQSDAHTCSWYGGENIDQKAMDQRYAAVCKRFDRPIKAGTVEVLRQLSGDAAANFDDRSLDFVYIDGDHRYEGVKDDLAKFAPKVKKGGLILLDDYASGSWWGDGVIRAANEFLASNSVRVDFKIGNQIAIRI